MEADGAQDIGRPVEAGLFQNEINGSPYDFWWFGNNASVLTQGSSITLYQNRFGRDTHPDNRTHSGATPEFELSGFSETLPDRKSTRLNSSHVAISYAVFCW